MDLTTWKFRQKREISLRALSIVHCGTQVHCRAPTSYY